MSNLLAARPRPLLPSGAQFSRGSSAYGEDGRPYGNNVPRVKVQQESQNLIRNGDFLSDLSYWAAANGGGGDGTITRVADSEAQSGYAVEYSLTNFGSYSFFYNNINSYFTAPKFDVNSRYYLVFKVKKISGSCEQHWCDIWDSNGVNPVIAEKRTTLSTGNYITVAFEFSPLQAGNTPVLYMRTWGSSSHAGVIRIADVKMIKLPTRSIIVEEGTTNYQSTPLCNALSGIAKVNGTYTDLTLVDNRHVLNGGACLRTTKIANGGAGTPEHNYATQGNNSLGSVSGKTVTFTIWFKASKAGMVVRGILQRNGGDWQTFYAPVTTTTGALQKITLTATFNESGTESCYTRIYFDDDTTSSPGDYLDLYGWQVEQKAYGSSFMVGTRSTESLTFPHNGVLTPTVGTVQMWVLTNSAFKRTNGNYAYLFHLARLSGGSGIRLFNFGTGVLRFATLNDAGNQTYNDVDLATYLWDGWHHIAAKWSTAEAKILVDGVLRGTTPTPNLPSEFNAGILGSLLSYYALGNSETGCYASDILVSSDYKSDAEIAANAASMKSMPTDANTVFKLKMGRRVA